jgi:predicted nucleotidyltransferase
MPRWWRGTNDLDISISLSMDELPAGLDSLPGWYPHASKEHEWIGPGNVKVDLIPAGPELLAAGEVIWSRSGCRMSLLGFRLAFERAVPYEAVAGFSIAVAPLPVIALLKMSAYLDRPYDRERDLQDLGYLLEEYLGVDDQRRYDAKVIDAGVEYDHISAYLLGQDLSGLGAGGTAGCA